MSDAVIRRMNPPTLPTPPGYSQVVAAAGARETILVSGQVALDQEGKLVGAGNPTAQADQAFKNLAAAVRAAGA